MKNKINWRSNADELAYFFQMVGKTPNNEFFITKMKGESNYTLKVDKKIFNFNTLEEAKSWCEDFQK